jgi:hypothetical protein
MQGSWLPALRKAVLHDMMQVLYYGDMSASLMYMWRGLTGIKTPVSAVNPQVPVVRAIRPRFPSPESYELHVL